MSLKTGNAKKYHVWLYNKCHEINLSDPLGYFLFYVILTISYFRAWTIEMSSLPNDSMRRLIEIFSGIPQAAQAHYVWVRASEVIWSEYTRIISVLSDAK